MRSSIVQRALRWLLPTSLSAVAIAMAVFLVLWLVLRPQPSGPAEQAAGTPAVPAPAAAAPAATPAPGRSAARGASPAAGAEAGPGVLHITTDPSVPSQIIVDGVPLGFRAMDVDVSAGQHTVAFGSVRGYIPPAPQTIEAGGGHVTNVVGRFSSAAELTVNIQPTLPVTVSVDGTARDNQGLSADYPPGEHTVCFGPADGYIAPPCQSVTLSAGKTTTLTATYTLVHPNAVLPNGSLRVTTDPPLPALVLLDGIPRAYWGLNWLTLPPGTYTLSFGPVEGYTAPQPQTVTIEPGVVAHAVGHFTPDGYLHVTTVPPAPGTILVDGAPLALWGLSAELPVGQHTVCFSDVPGLVTPACSTITISAGETTEVQGSYKPAGQGSAP